MQATSYLRLLPTDDVAWTFFPEFKRRVRQFVVEHLPATEAESVVYDVSNRWTSLPGTTGFWLAFCGNKPVAHMLSWVLETYGRPYVFIYQAECDEGYSLGHIQRSIFADMDRWVDGLNAIIPEGRPKIDRGELSTWRDAASFAKYLEATGREAVKVRSVLAFTVGSNVPKLLL